MSVGLKPTTSGDIATSISNICFQLEFQFLAKHYNHGLADDELENEDLVRFLWKLVALAKC